VFCSDVRSASTKRQEDAALGWGSEVAPSVGDDEVIQLRQWGTDQVHVLPRPLIQRGSAGIVTTCPLRFTDLGILLKHAELIYERNQWRIRDLEGTVGLRQDGEPRREFVLAPGVEVGIGTTILIAESRRSIALREFCARVLGWGTGRMGAVDHALRAIRLAAAWRSTLVLRGEEDQVPLAHALHRHVLGADAPFVVCDRRREDLPASVRSPANRGSGVAAFEIAAGGSLCVRSRRLPHDLPELLKLLYEPDHRVQLIVCTKRHARDDLLSGSMPIEVPPLGVRETELPRIVQAYAEDAIAALSAQTSSFSDEDHDWVMQHNTQSFSEIEKATLRLVALNMMDNVHQAARLLGMAQVSLSRWLHRRMRPRTRAAVGNS
jgi:hypothetical protein